MIFVSHSMPTISSFCTRAILLDHGHIKSDPDEDMASVIQKYLALSPIKKQVAGDPDQQIIRFLHMGVPVTEPVVVKHGDRLELDAVINLDEESELSLIVLAEGTLPLIQFHLGDDSSTGRPFAPGSYQFHIDLGIIDLSPSKYTVDVTLKNNRTNQAKRLDRAFYIVVEHHRFSWHHMLRAAPVTITSDAMLKND
jgi:hypothetical protein